MLVIYLLVALAQIKRRRAFERHGERLAIRMWLFPWLSYATAIGIALVLLSMLFRAAERAQLAASALSVGVVLAAFWWQWRRRS
jgi:GABA permease